MKSDVVWTMFALCLYLLCTMFALCLYYVLMSFNVKIGKIHHQVTKKRRTRRFENKKREGHEDFRRH